MYAICGAKNVALVPIFVHVMPKRGPHVLHMLYKKLYSLKVSFSFYLKIGFCVFHTVNCLMSLDI